ncbi:MAG: glycine cleavage system aminomethyltransferase GcvT [Candidatus Saganbacteria bacterium]|nr:glycine cleavage system aminomethyltransferase GcvT [Candidatus Saganbacteria bacterium]
MPEKTPLYETHISGGARIVEFAGWLLPVQYGGIIEEHKAVRNTCGMFDIGHMGQIEVPDLDAVQKLTTNDASKLEKGSGQYSFVCNESGGIIDDLLVYRLENSFLVISNGINARAVFELFKTVSPSTKLLYDKNTMLAVQGPDAICKLQKDCDIDLLSLKHRQIAGCRIFGIKCTVSRSGYTGEDGAEIILDNNDAKKLWKSLLDENMMPCGLGSRDTLRIEASLPLYGHELSQEITPVDAGYFKTVKYDKGNFTGKSALQSKKEKGPDMKLIGFEVSERAIPRQGYKIFEGENEIGCVTSGTFSPTLGRPIGMGYLKQIQKGGQYYIEIRGRKYPAKEVGMPFYRRKKA